MSHVPSCVSVVFPGIVNDVSKFMNMIGGLNSLEKVFNSRSDRLEMRFRPEDVYSHAVYGDRVKVDQILVKVKRKRVVYDDGSDEVSFSTTVTGVIDHSYQFTSMCDFQYLPMERTSGGAYVSVMSELIPPDALDPEAKDKTFRAKAPLRILPTIFSRFDMPVEYYFKSGANHTCPETLEERDRRDRQSQIGRIRKSRASAGISVTWAMLANAAPAETRKEAVDAYEKEIKDQSLLPKLKNLFDEHPVYTRNKLLYLLQCTTTELRYALPLVAYSITDGPFRKSWSRLGHNPRQERTSLQYQVMDFRIKKHDIRAKRSVYQYQLPLQRGEESNPRNKRFMPAARIDESLLLDSVVKEQEMLEQQKRDDRQTMLRGQFVFAPGLVPSVQQILCQLLDIELDCVKDLIAAGSDRSEPDERDGWLPAGSIENIRSEMSAALDSTLSARQQDQDGNDDPAAGPSHQTARRDDDETDEEDSEMDEAIGSLEIS